MKLFTKLVINELYKSFLQKKTIAFIIFIVVATAGLAYVAGEDDVQDWRADKEATVTQLEKSIAEYDQGQPVSAEEGKLGIEELKTQLAFEKACLENDAPDNTTTPIKFVYIGTMNISLLIMLFVIAFSADVIAGEYSGGTIRQILVRPVKRWKVFIAKYCSTILVSIFMFTFSILLSAIMGFVIFGGNGSGIYNIERMADNEIVKINMISNILLTVLAQVFAIAVISTIAFFVATVTRKSVLAILISAFIVFGGAIMAELLMDYDFYQYLLVPNLMLNAYIPGGWIPFDGASFVHSLTVCLVHAAGFFTAGIWIFNKRDIY